MRRLTAALAVTLAVTAIWAAGPTATSGAAVGEGVVVERADGPNSAYVVLQNGEISLDLTGASDPAGAGVNANATTYVDDVFVVRNAGERAAFVYVTDESQALGFYRSTGARPSVEGAANETRLAPGEQTVVGLSITPGVNGVVSAADVTIHARVSEAVQALFDAGGPVPDGEPMPFDATPSEGDNLEYDWQFGDGETGTGPTPTHTYDDPGIYRVVANATDSQETEDGASDQVVVLAAENASQTPATPGERVTFDDEDTSLNAVTLDPTNGGFDRSNVRVLPEGGAKVRTGSAVPGDRTILSANVTADRPEAPADLTVTLDMPDETSASTLGIRRYDDDIDEWTRLDTTVNERSGSIVTLSARTTESGVFAVTAPGPGTQTPTPEPTPEPTEEQAGGGGGGGGGGGAAPRGPSCRASGRVEPTLDSASVTYSTLESTTTEGVEFAFAGDAGGVISVTCLNGEAPRVGPAGPAVVDHYRLSVPERSQGQPVTVSLAVRSNRVQQVGVLPEPLVIKRWEAGAWRPVETSVQRAEGAVVLTAQLSSLPSLLAVATPGAAKVGRDGPTPTPTDRPSAPTSGVQSPSTPNVDRSAEQVTATPGSVEDSGGLIDVVLPVLVLLVIATGVAIGWVLITRSAARFYERR